MTMLYHTPVRKQILHRQVHSSMRCVKYLILRLNWQFKYKIGCNWNINGHQNMTHKNNFLCTSLAAKVAKPIV